MENINDSNEFPSVSTKSRRAKKSKRLYRGFAHELEVAESVINESGGEAYFASSPVQERLQSVRRRYLDLIMKDSPDEASEILRLAVSAAEKLPHAYGPVSFVEVSANGGEVYDILYGDKEGNIIPVSCKLSEMEDKSYRFNSSDFIIPSVDSFSRSLFTPDDVSSHRSFFSALERHGMGVADVQREVVGIMEKALLEGEGNEDAEMILKLTSERFIGHGGFWKTLSDGNIRFYPRQCDNDVLTVVDGSVRTTPTSLVYVVALMDMDAQSRLKQLYKVNFRVKFKDGINKPVKLSRLGSPSNLAGTITLTLLDHSEVGDDDL